MYPDSTGPLLFFDGVCNLCNRVVQFIIKHDRRKLFLFASLQSQAGSKALSQIQTPLSTVPDSIVLFYKGKYYIKSDAALLAAKLLGGAWAVLYAFIIVPRFVRNSIYDLIARNRYKWFGKQDACMIPTPELRSRFLE